MPLNLTELRELLEAINRMDIAELILKSDEFELTVRRETLANSQLIPTGAGRTVTSDFSPIAPSAIAHAPSPTTDSNTSLASAAGSAPAVYPPTNERRRIEILSPMVGTFYRAPAPDEPPFVEVGERVRVGQTVCIIEAMKLMNEIESEVNGEILEILVQNGEPVEYNQPLMRVSPS